MPAIVVAIQDVVMIGDATAGATVLVLDVIVVTPTISDTYTVGAALTTAMTVV